MELKETVETCVKNLRKEMKDEGYEFGYNIERMLLKESENIATLCNAKESQKNQVVGQALYKVLKANRENLKSILTEEDVDMIEFFFENKAKEDNFEFNNIMYIVATKGKQHLPLCKKVEFLIFMDSLTVDVYNSIDKHYLEIFYQKLKPYIQSMQESGLFAKKSQNILENQKYRRTSLGRVLVRQILKENLASINQVDLNTLKMREKTAQRLEHLLKDYFLPDAFKYSKNLGFKVSTYSNVQLLITYNGIVRIDNKTFVYKRPSNISNKDYFNNIVKLNLNLDKRILNLTQILKLMSYADNHRLKLD